MPRQRYDWRESRTDRAARTLDEITVSIAALGADCLLDLHDIFREKPDTTLVKLAEAEMAQRGLTAGYGQALLMLGFRSDSGSARPG